LSKAGNIKFSITFQLEFEFETATTKTKILPKAGKIKISIPHLSGEGC